MFYCNTAPENIEIHHGDVGMNYAKLMIFQAVGLKPLV
jgi:hypothetical protein